MTSHRTDRCPISTELTPTQHSILHRLVATAPAPTAIWAIVTARFRPDNSGLVLVELSDGQLQLWGISRDRLIQPLVPAPDTPFSGLLQAPHAVIVPGSDCRLLLQATQLDLHISTRSGASAVYTMPLPQVLHYIVQ